jgi:serine/threonine-protein kinase HipA
MAQKKAEVYYNGILTGILVKEDHKYSFQYAEEYLRSDKHPAISLSFPKRKEPFVSDHLFPFFYGLLAEGENKELQCRMLKIDGNDHFTRLIKTAFMDTIGGVTVKEV